MRVAIYARVSTERQQERGTIGSQLAVLRDRVSGDELVAEFCDDGHSGARLDRPGLDALRDAAEAGLFDGVWCLSPDRLARVYAYQVIVLDELARHGVNVRFTDAPALDDDPQAKLLTQVQGVIAEYERAKIAERYRRGKLFRSRAGEVLAWRVPYGYRRLARDAAGPARLEIFEPEAAVVRRIFADRVDAGFSVRQIAVALTAEAVPSPTGKTSWGTSTLCRLLRNEAYIGRVHFNQTETVPDTRPGHKTRQVPRPREEWIPIQVPALISEDVFEAAGRVSHDNSQWSPRRAEPGQWLLRGLVKCGSCGVGVNCHKMRGRNGTWHRYYYCRNHDPVRAGGEARRCPERNIRADILDNYVFDQLRDVLTRPDVLLTGEHAVATRTPAPDNELLAAELARLDRKLEGLQAERRRLADLYQAGLVELADLQRRASDLDHRRTDVLARQHTLSAERAALTRDNKLRTRLHDFADRARGVIDHLDFDTKQNLLRQLVDDVQVAGWHVKIRLRIPLDEPHPHSDTSTTSHSRSISETASTKERLRSVGVADVSVVQEPVHRGGGQRLGHQLVEGGRVQVRADRHGSSLVGGVDEAVEAPRRRRRRRAATRCRRSRPGRRAGSG